MNRQSITCDDSVLPTAYKFSLAHQMHISASDIVSLSLYNGDALVIAASFDEYPSQLSSGCVLDC